MFNYSEFTLPLQMLLFGFAAELFTSKTFNDFIQNGNRISQIKKNRTKSADIKNKFATF